MYQIIRVQTNRQRLLAMPSSAKEALRIYAMHVQDDGSIVVVDPSGDRIDVTELTVRAALE